MWWTSAILAVHASSGCWKTRSRSLPQDLVITGSLVLTADRILGLMVVDVSSPDNPRIVGNLGEFGEGVFAAGRLAYYTAHTPELQTIDLADPASPRVLGRTTLADFGHRVAVTDGIAYVADGLGGLVMVDVSNPRAPTRLGQLAELPGYARDVALAGDYAYLALQDGGMAIVDVSDPLRPVLVALYRTGG